MMMHPSLGDRSTEENHGMLPIYPLNLCFSKNGIAIIKVQNQEFATGHLLPSKTITNPFQSWIPSTAPESTQQPKLG
jgi:hypothetical protein